MNPLSQHTEEALFRQAIKLETSAERAAFLDRACIGNPALRARLDDLLEGHFEGQGFLTHLPARSPIPQQPPAMDGKYQLLEKIGEGGFGEVWRAEQLHPVRRFVAIKILKAGMDTRQVVARFEAERQALALMDHANIARVFDAGSTESGRPYFVMELVRGTRITEYCKQHGVGLNDRLQLFILVCQAIQHAHQKGIIHRDIKPSNVLVSLQDGAPGPKVIDFGIAKATQQDLTDKTVLTQFQQFLGTPAYISPEQALLTSEDIDTRSDIYALGVLLYELLVGKPPFDNHELLTAGVDEMRRIIREKEPRPPSAQVRSNASTIDPDLDWIAMKCLEKDRTRRYPTANALAADLQRYLHHEPVMARPPSAAYRLQKAFRRNRLVCTSAAVIFLAIMVGAAVSLAMFLRAQREKSVALQATSDLRKHIYVAEMGVAHQALLEGNLARAHRLIEAQSGPGISDLRGFEWRYLWQQARGDQRNVLAPYSGFIGGLALSPTGQWLALNQADPTRVEILQFTARSLVRSLPLTNAITPLRFSPDGALLLGQSNSGIIGWNTQSWDPIEPLPVHFPLGFLPDGKRFLAQEEDHFSVWSTETWKKLAEIKEAKALPAIQAWASQQALAISPDGSQFYYLRSRWQIGAWDLQTEKPLAPIELDQGALITCLALSPEGMLAISGWDGTVRVIDLKTREWVAQFNEHLSWISGLAFLPDGMHLVSASADQTIVIYKPRTRSVSARLRGHDTEIWALAVAPDGKSLLTGAGYDGTVLQWPLNALANNTRPDAGLVVRVLADGRLLRYIPGARDFERYDIASRKGEPAGMEQLQALVRRPIYPSDFQSGAPGWIVISPDGRWTVSNAGEQLSVTIVNSFTGQAERVLSNKFGRIMHASFSDDGALLALFGKDSEVSLFETANWSGGARTGLLPGRAAAIFTPARYLIIVNEESGVTVQDPLANLVAHFVSSNLTWTSTAISKDGRYFALGGQDNLIRIYDVRNGKALPPLAGHAAGVWGLAFSPDGRTLASAGDKRIKLWSVDTWQEFFTLHSGERNPHGLSFSSDGRYLVSHAPFQVWEAPSLEEINTAEAQTKRPAN